MSTLSANLPTQLSEGLPLQVVPHESLRTDAEREQILASPGFGQNFSDHMIVIQWSEGQGWHDARLQAYQPFTLDPAAAVLHYAQEIFEGLKAYYRADGTIATFRPEANAERFNNSARRLAMPELPPEAFVAACDALVLADRDWIPTGGERSLYLRPYMFATEAFLGVRPSKEYVFCVIASPAAGYFGDHVSGVSVYASEDYVRAVPGGTGEAKCGGNYAASLLAQAQAAHEGCDQVVWLDGVERKYVEEMGGMNLFFVYGSDPDNVEILTPDLSGSLLPGITRRSLMEAAGDLGVTAVERKISLQQWREDVASGAITEVFACGTAAVITPVYTCKARTGDFEIGTEPGPVTMRLREHLLGVQYGTVDDAHSWIHTIG